MWYEHTLIIGFLFFICLVFSCEQTEHTEHSFGVWNNSENRDLRITYQTVDQEYPVSILVDSLRGEYGVYGIPNWTENGDENRLTMEEIKSRFTTFVLFDQTDTFSSTPLLKEWEYIYGGEDSGYKGHTYLLKITDQDLK